MSNNVQTVAMIVRETIKGYRAATDRDSKMAALAIFRAHPEAALAEIQRGSTEEGLTMTVFASVLEDVLGEVSDPKEARKKFESYIGTERRVELLKSRGDLPSVTAYIASCKDLRLSLLSYLADLGRHMKSEPEDDGSEDLDAEDTIEAEGSEENSDETDVSDDAEADERLMKRGERVPAAPPPPPVRESVPKKGRTKPTAEFVSTVAHHLRAWAMKHTDHPDYFTLIDGRIGARRIREYLLCAVWIESGRPVDTSLVHSDLLSEVRLHDEDSIAKLEEMVETHHFPSFSPELFAEAYAKLFERMQGAEKKSALDAQSHDEAHKAKEAANF
jgi:hypothetical protein